MNINEMPEEEKEEQEEEVFDEYCEECVIHYDTED